METAALCDERARALAQHLMTLAPLTISATRDGLNRLSQRATPDDIDLIQRCYLSDDFAEGIDAFFAKRKANGVVNECATEAPLNGMRVIELAHIMAGPLCGMMLADMGADVIKVEKIEGGDDSRRMVPPNVGEESAAFLMMNRNKRGMALDLKSDDGKNSHSAFERRRLCH